MLRMQVWFAGVSLAVAMAGYAGAAPAPERASTPIAQAQIPALAGYWRMQPDFIVNNERGEPGPSGLARDWILFDSYKNNEKPPLTPEAFARVRQEFQDEVDGKAIIDERTRNCLAAGFYDSLSFGSLDIHQRDNQVLFVSDRDRAKPRRVYLTPNRFNIEDLEPMLGGDARGRYEGGVLVVNARHFDTAPYLFRGDFLRASEELQVTERYWLEDGGKTLAARWVFTDPKTFTRPWTLNIRWNRQPATFEPPEETCVPNARFE